MPIYEYRCQACGHELEALQKLSDAPLTDCPECGEQGKGALKKKISAAAFRLKGGGWYETDFKTGNKKNIAGERAPDDKGKGQDRGDSSGKGKEGKDSAAKSGDSKSGGAKKDSSGASSAGAS